jgi:hypothetical protein
MQSRLLGSIRPHNTAILKKKTDRFNYCPHEFAELFTAGFGLGVIKF